MAEYSATATLTSSGGSLTFNNPSDAGKHDPEMCDGLDQCPVRNPEDDKAMTHGAILHPRLYGARPVLLGGWIVASTVSARTTFTNSLKNVLEGMMGATGTYTWVASDGTHVITVWCDIALKTTGGWQKKYLFGLKAADHTIS